MPVWSKIGRLVGGKVKITGGGTVSTSHAGKLARDPKALKAHRAKTGAKPVQRRGLADARRPVVSEADQRRFAAINRDIKGADRAEKRIQGIIDRLSKRKNLTPDQQRDLKHLREQAKKLKAQYNALRTRRNEIMRDAGML